MIGAAVHRVSKSRILNPDALEPMDRNSPIEYQILLRRATDKFDTAIKESGWESCHAGSDGARLKRRQHSKSVHESIRDREHAPR